MASLSHHLMPPPRAFVPGQMGSKPQAPPGQQASVPSPSLRAHPGPVPPALRAEPAHPADPPACGGHAIPSGSSLQGSSSTSGSPREAMPTGWGGAGIRSSSALDTPLPQPARTAFPRGPIPAAILHPLLVSGVALLPCVGCRTLLLAHMEAKLRLPQPVPSEFTATAGPRPDARWKG